MPQLEKPTEAQIREFWEWCEFKYIDKKLDEHWVFTPKGTDKRISVYGDRWITPDELAVIGFLPQINLDNLFEYAVPKVREILNESEQIVYPFHKFMLRWAYAIAISRKDPALALFWAIWKVIHNGE